MKPMKPSPLKPCPLTPSVACLAAVLVAVLVSGAARAAAPAARPDAGVDRRPTVAVLYFEYEGEDASLRVLRKGLAQMLISDLAGLERIRIVERARLEEIQAELALGASKRVDPETAARIGRLLGARYLVLGGFFDLMSALRVDARVVDVETGRIVQSVGVTGAAGDFLGVEQQMADRLGSILAGELPPLPAPGDDVKRAPDAEPPKVRRPKPPKKLVRKTAVRYSEALDARDRGDDKAAKKALEEVLQEQPDFELARIDLETLMQ